MSCPCPICAPWEWGRKDTTGAGIDPVVREVFDAKRPQCWCGRKLGQCSRPMPNVQRWP